MLDLSMCATITWRKKNTHLFHCELSHFHKRRKEMSSIIFHSFLICSFNTFLIKCERKVKKTLFMRTADSPSLLEKNEHFQASVECVNFNKNKCKIECVHAYVCLFPKEWSLCVESSRKKYELAKKKTRKKY